MLVNVGRESYAAKQIPPEETCREWLGRAGEAECGAGFGGRSTKALTAQKQRDRLDSRNNPEGFFRSGRLNIRLGEPDVTLCFCAVRA